MNRQMQEDENYIEFIKQRLYQSERLLLTQQTYFKSLLALTDAINKNIARIGLFNILEYELRSQLGIGRIAMFVLEQNWTLPIVFNADEKTLASIHPETAFKDFPEIANHAAYALPDNFEVLISMKHKESILAYLLIGGMPSADDEIIDEKLSFLKTLVHTVVVANENKRLAKEEISRKLLDKEISMAADIQKMLIPKRLPQSEKWSITANYIPLKVVAGDYYDAIKLANDKILFCVADVSGKGVSAGLLMANIQASFKMLASTEKSLLSLVERLNTAIEEITEGEKFLSMFVGLYEPETKKMAYINAGHNAPILIQNDEFHYLKTGCPILGCFDELPSIQVGECSISSGDKLFCFTDGLTDVLDEKAELFGDERLELSLKNHYQTADWANRVLDEVTDFAKNGQITDDITVLSVKFA